MLNFTQATDTFLYTADGSGGFLAFYLIEGRGTAPASLSLDIAWSTSTQQGYFIFLAKDPGSVSSLYAALEAYRKGPSSQLPAPAHSSLAWIEYSESKASVQPLQVMNIAAATTPLITGNCLFAIGAYKLPLLEGMRVQTGTNDSFIFSYPDYTDSPAPVPANQVVLHLNGSLRGCFTTEATIADFTADGLTGWNAALYYFTPDKNSAIPHRYLLFRQQQGLQVMFLVYWDPLRLLDPARTYLAFEGNAFLLVQDGNQFSIQSAGPVTLTSGYRTAKGDWIGLRPLAAARTAAGPARLVIASMPVAPYYYLAPAGDFEMTAVQEDGTMSADTDPALLCGSSGTETIAFRPASETADGDTMSFFPGNAAYAPIFPLNGQPQASTDHIQDSNNTSLLQSTWQTSWVGFHSFSGKSMSYQAQPEYAPAFAAGKQQTPAADAASFLPFHALKAGDLSVTQLTDCFPLAPVAAVTQGNEDGFAPQFEQQIIGPTRRSSIAGFGKMSQTQESEAPVRITTPQGLLAQVNGTKWEQLLLASNTDNGQAQTLSFGNLNATLQAAFQTNDLFLVISDNKYLQQDGTVFNNVISIEGWPFHLDVNQAKEGLFSNVLIFKFCKGNVLGRIGDPGQWTNAQDFNGADPNNMLLLTSWLKDTITGQSGESYDYFNRIVQDPNWNGILALNVTIGLQDFPQELQGLLAGMDLSRFTAHHFGVNANRVAPNTDGVLTMSAESSLFGLIDYADNGNDTKSGQDYDFTVLRLKVLFRNSAIQSFDSSIRLTFQKILGSGVTGDDKSVELNGVYENHSGSKSYAFNLAEQKVFEADNQVLRSLSIVKAQFSTLQQLNGKTSGATPQTEVHSRFSFWGDLVFYDLSPETAKAHFDPFSFDSLHYSSLELNMDFVINNPAGKTFTLTSLNMSFDMQQSTIRGQSMYKRFPLQLSALVIGGEKQKPSDTGFLQVVLPYKTGQLAQQWYGLQFNINFGSPGSLAEKSPFTASLLMAWSPGSGSVNAAVFLRLPGSAAGKRQLSLQGVLTIGADSYRFLSYNADGKTDENGYLLALKNMGLFFLGIRVPPGFGTDIILFGNPDPAAANDTLGWYAAYNPSK